MQLRDVMTEDVALLDAQATLSQAAKMMKDKNVGAVPVRKGDKIAGLITDRDIVIRGLAQGANPDKQTVSEIMTSPLVYCFEDQSLEEVAELMELKKMRRLPVMSREKRLIGIVSLSDVAVDGTSQKLAGKVLSAVSAMPLH